LGTAAFFQVRLRIITIIPDMADAVRRAGLINPLSSNFAVWHEIKYPSSTPGTSIRAALISIRPKRRINTKVEMEIIVPKMKILDSDPLSFGPFWC